jgi:hypothetical protein
MNNNRMLKIMLNCRPSGRGQLGRPWKRLSDEAETGLLGRNSWHMMKILIKKLHFCRNRLIRFNSEDQNIARHPVSTLLKLTYKLPSSSETASWFKVGSHVTQISDTANTMTQCYIPEALNFKKIPLWELKI